MSVTVFPPKPAGLTTADRAYIASESTNPTELAAAIPTPDVSGDVAAYGTAKTTDVTTARDALLAALQPAGLMARFKFGAVPAGWTQFSGPPPDYSGYTALTLMPGIGTSANTPSGIVFATPGSYGLHVLYVTSGGAWVHKRFDEASGAWVTLPNPPTTPSTSVAVGAYVATSDNRILLASSSGASATTAAYVYNPATQTWTAVASMPAACRGGGGERLASGKIYVCGDAASAYAYDVAGNSWSSVAKLAAQSTFTFMAYCRLPSGNLMAVSGTSYYVYNEGTNSWSSSALPGSISVSNATAIPTATGALLSTGSAVDTSSAKQWQYTESGDSWATSSVNLVAPSSSNVAKLTDGTYVFAQAGTTSIWRVQAGTTPAAQVWAYKN